MRRNRQALSRIARSPHDLVEIQRGAGREDQPVARAVDQAFVREAFDRVERVLSLRLRARLAADKLVHRPRPLIVLAEEPDHNAPLVPRVILGRLVRLLLHRKVLPFGATAPGQFTLSLGPISRMQPTLDFRGDGRKGFRQGFRQRLLGVPVPNEAFPATNSTNETRAPLGMPTIVEATASTVG